jgi:hypothetical protein
VREIPLGVDAVEKVSGALTGRNNRIHLSLVNQSCAFDARFESILLGPSLKILSLQHGQNAKNSR